MKILELEIENIRGIRQKIPFKLGGENLSIQGPNGSGKSAVVDGIDFLFTGDISRLGGRGTRGITLKGHGKHIDADIKDAFVAAKIQIRGVKKPITLMRKMSRPKQLVINPQIKSEALMDVLEIARRGQHVLSRSEILRFIAAESSERAKGIQEILNLTEIEYLRQTLGTIRREADRRVQAERAALERSMDAINTTIAIGEFSETEVLNKVNEKREILGGTPVERLNPNLLQKGVSPVGEYKEHLNPERLRRILFKALDIIQKQGIVVYSKEKELRQSVHSLKEDEILIKDLASKKLIELGVSLLDETEACPLCLKPWKPIELREFLVGRKSRVAKAEKIEAKIRKLATEINTIITNLMKLVSEIAESAKKMSEKDIGNAMQPWIQVMSGWSEKLQKATEDYEPEECLGDEVKTFCAPQDLDSAFTKLREKADTLEKLTPEQQAWDTLTRLISNLERYLEDKEKYEQAQRFAVKAKVFDKTYTDIKDRVLRELYDSVNEDFVAYYKFLHGEDEDSFYSELKPEGPQLDLKVDFHGRGAYHPRALHSEGHQDSMGLCLYLALNRKISGDAVQLVILDDVVMSIDNNHRRKICKLLTQHFPDRQFIITTHNRTWERLLNTDGVVKKKNMIEFRGWSLETGPMVGRNGDVWADIRKKLDVNDVSSAAQQLREHCEFFYDNVCDSLRAEVRHRIDGRHELGDYLKGANKALKKCLKQTKASANSWGKKEEVEELSNRETQIDETIKRTQMEHWGINENVHYTRWKDSEKDDFLPIVEAFQDLEEFFICPGCQGILSLNMKGETPSNVTCPCGQIFWNLEMKKK